MSSNIVSDKLFSKIEAHNFGAKGSVSKENNFFVNILSQSSKDVSKDHPQEVVKEEKQVDKTFLAEETSDIRDKGGLEDPKIDKELTIGNDNGVVAEESISVKSALFNILCVSEGGVEKPPIQYQITDIADLQEQAVLIEGDTTDDAIIKEQDINAILLNSPLVNPTLLEKEIFEKELAEKTSFVICEKDTSNVKLTGDIELSAYISEVSKFSIRQESFDQNLEKTLNTSNTKAVDIYGIEITGNISSKMSVANIQQEVIKFGAQDRVDSILPQNTNHLLGQESIPLNKTIDLDIVALNHSQAEMSLVNSSRDGIGQVVSKVPSDINTKHIQSTISPINFQPIKIQDITKNTIKKDESIFLDKSFDFVVQPLIIQNGDQLLVSYKDVQNQSDVKVTYSEQVIVSIKTAVSQGKSQILLSMYPEHLGVVDVKIEFNDLKEIASIKVFVEKPETLQLLQKDSENLLDSLKMITKSDDASLSFNLRDGQNEQTYYEESTNNNNSSNMEDTVNSTAEEAGRNKLSTNNNTDIDITI
jgi:hypothetical protein